MSRFLPLSWVSLALALPAWPQTCAPAEHDPITAGDLARLAPAFGRLPAGTPLAPAPGPGVHRVFRALELMSLARKYSLDLPSAEDLCFALPLESLDRARLLDAMKAALPFPEARIEILETSLQPAPRGRIEFRREDLGAPALPESPAPVVWKGNVLYGAGQRFAIWARVVVTARIPRLVAVEPIRRGRSISAAQLRVQPADVFPGRGDAASSLDQVAGRIAVANIAAGAEIHLSQVESPLDVKRGDTVQVEVHSGLTHLALTGKAETNGRTGDFITLRNLRSNRIFQARVDGEDRASLDLGAPQRN